MLLSMCTQHVYYLHICFAGDLDEGIDTLEMSFLTHVTHTYDEYGHCTGYGCEEYNGDFYLNDYGSLVENKTSLPYTFYKDKQISIRTLNDNIEFTSVSLRIRSTDVNPRLSIKVVYVKNGNYSTIVTAEMKYEYHFENNLQIYDRAYISFPENKTYTGHLYITVSCSATNQFSLLG